MCHKNIRAIASLICAAVLLLSVGLPAMAADTYKVTADTADTLKQGEKAYCFVSIDSTTSLAALDISVHFDADKIRILDISNSADCLLYDSIKKESSIQFSYIFGGEGTSAQSELFCFSYEILSDAQPGSTWFDIIIGEAYDASLKDLPVSGDRCYLTIAENVPEKRCYFHCTSSVSTAVTREFQVDYWISTDQVASGTAQILYDPELFDLVCVEPGAFLEGKTWEAETDLPGSVNLTFTGTKYNNATALISLRFRTRENVDGTSLITFNPKEMRDLEQSSIAYVGCSTVVSVTYDEEYLGDVPAMELSAVWDEDIGQVVAVIRLDADSHLGAGDFVLRFDSEWLDLVSWHKGFKPNFFNVNQKEAAEGILKFSIISLSDIVTEETVLTLVFDAYRTCQEQELRLELTGSMLADSLTDPIRLNIVGGNVTVPAGAHIYEPWRVTKDGTCTENGEKRRDCAHCDHYETAVIEATGHHHGLVDSKEPTATEDGYEIWRCPDCGDEYTEVLPATGEPVLWGDVNGDRSVDYMDAYLIMRYAVGYITEDELDLHVADVNGDEAVDYMDAYLIMRLAVGYIDKFPVE